MGPPGQRFSKPWGKQNYLVLFHKLDIEKTNMGPPGLEPGILAILKYVLVFSQGDVIAARP